MHEQRVRMIIFMANDELNYRLLKVLQDEPEISQRGLSERLGVSLGKVNYCLNALIERGLIKARNFKNSDNKRAYAYFLTPSGIEEKSKVAIRFLRHKMAEYEKLRAEIRQLQREMNN